MGHRFGILVCIFTAIVIYVPCRQEPIAGERHALAAPLQASARLESFDTLKYDDGKWISSVLNVIPGDKLGVWFTPPRGSEVCSLYAVQYFFRSRSGIDTGFVNLVSKYDGITPLWNIGRLVRSFALYPGTNTTVLPVPIPVRNDSDFLIGWDSKWVDTSISPIGLRDSAANYAPRRSYRKMAKLDTLVPLPYDLAVRAIFKRTVISPDTGKFTFELRWDKKNTDLDLYLILHRDTVFWHKRSIGSIKLDVDDNDGYGPEKIVCPIAADSSAVIGVHYYGPNSGPSTPGSVLVRKNNESLVTLGRCTLRSKDWWTVARIDLRTGQVTARDSCKIVRKPGLSSVSKRTPSVSAETERILSLKDPFLRGNDVKAVQVGLRSAGFTINTDGVFGKRTDKVVKAFQKSKGLKRDGIIGPATRAALGL